MSWIKTAFEVFVQAVKARDRLFVRIVPCVCKYVGPKACKMINKNWIVFCPSCKNRTDGEYRSKRTAKLVWKKQNEEKG